MNVFDFGRMKHAGQKITMVTSYDHWSARLVARTPLDCILVGDSVAMVIHGHPNTLAATPEMMALHTHAVFRGAPDKFIVADMPFGSYRKGIASAMDCVEQLMRAGATAVKLEGVDGHEDVIKHIIGSGVPVMGHLGLTPQSIHGLGGFKVQGRDDMQAEHLLRQARALEHLGCFAVVLECIPSALASAITNEISIPTIGIGAGVQVDGQVLVLQDLLGMNMDFKPKFLKRYMEGEKLIREALTTYDAEVKAMIFPTTAESYA